MHAYDYDRDCGEYTLTATDYIVGAICLIVYTLHLVLTRIGATKR